MKLLGVFLLGLIVLGGLSAWGQEEEEPAPIVIMESAPPTPPFSRPIDPDLYLIRPGDELQITFVKSQLDPLIVEVNPEGRIVDRLLGAHDLAFRTLTEARDILGAALKKLYNIPGITIDVTRSRLVKIVITGAVAMPGTYEVYSCDKVSDIIKLAGGITSEGSRRWILFTGGPSPVKIDLDRTQYLGDPDADPGVYAGRTIHIPRRSPNTVHVGGEVINPREIELVPGDDLATLISLAGGLRRYADSTATRVVSRSGKGSRENIKPGDIIIIPPKVPAPDEIFVSVFGDVGNQGVYNFRDGMTLGDALDAAGGLLPDANLDLITVFRRPRMDSRGRFTTQRYPISKPLADREEPLTMRLMAEDSIFVPVNVGFVKVVGAVVHPGYFAYVRGKVIQYYVELAGGFLPTANENEIALYNPVSGVTLTSSPGVLVHDGATISVKMREEFK